RQGLNTAFHDGARAGRYDFSAFEQRANRRVMLELLEHFERLEFRMRVIQPDHEADIHAIIVKVVQEAAAISIVVQWPADAVLYGAGRDATGWQLPEFLESESVGLRRRMTVQFELSNQLFRDRTAATFRQYRQPGMNVDTGRIVRSMAAVVLDTHVATA